MSVDSAATPTVEEPIQVQDVVQIANVSRRSLELRFREFLGSSVHDEIRRARVNYIARMLLETNYTILRISVIMGFSSVANMGRYFKEEKGITPLAFRKKFKYQYTMSNL